MSDPLDWSVRTAFGVGTLVLLLAWESLAPFFLFFGGPGGRRERVRHGVRNTLLWMINGLFTSFLFAGLWWMVAQWVADHSFGVLNWLDLPAWGRLVAVFLLFDCWMWLWHHLNHRVPLLWRFHRVHHSDAEMDVTTANRFHIGEVVISSVLRVPVIALLGVRIWELALYEIVMFAVVQVHHANIALPGSLDRWLRVILVTPFMHKGHHSRWQPETDSNYASLFSFWDRLFGTFRLREDPHEIRIGLEGLDAPDDQTMVGLLATPFRAPKQHATSRVQEVANDSTR